MEGGIAKEKARMDLLWQELRARNIPLSIVVYPYPAQVLHDTTDSRQVQIWRQWCEGKCRRFISVFPPFIAAKQQCPASTLGCWYLTYFIFGDDHYSAAGNALVADAVIKAFRKTHRLKGGRHIWSRGKARVATRMYIDEGQQIPNRTRREICPGNLRAL